MKIFSCLLLVLLLPVQDEPVIEWAPGKKLTWKNFRGLPESNTDAAATTVSALSYQFQGYMKGRKVVYEYDVKALFFPEKSWVRPKLMDEELLLHEQLHFDITAWYAARLRKSFDTISPGADPGPAIRKVYEQIRKELDSVQARYDRETDFSRNTREQLLWQSRINAYIREAYE